LRILVIALSGIGDALMYTPSLNKISEEIPSADIDILVMYNGVKDIFEKLPQVSKVLHFDFLNSSKLKALMFVLKLRYKYDATINVYPANRKEYNFISWLIGAQQRAAVKYLRKDFANLGFLNNITILENDDIHNVEENILLTGKITKQISKEISPLLINLRQDDINYAAEFLKDRSIDTNELVIGFHPGCSPLKNHSKRRWAPKNFSELGKRLIESHNARILLFGGGEEEVLKDQILSEINSPNVLSVNTFVMTKTAALMKRCNLFITNDSSLMHVAAALQLNTIALIGPTNKNYIYPWKTNHKIVSLKLECSPCFHYSPKPLTCTREDVKYKCIIELPVDMVYKAAKEFL
jgi:heptosyltransferase II